MSMFSKLRRRNRLKGRSQLLFLLLAMGAFQVVQVEVYRLVLWLDLCRLPKARKEAEKVGPAADQELISPMNTFYLST